MRIDVYYKPDTLDCYTVFIEYDGEMEVYAMSEGGKVFNQFLDSCTISDKAFFKYKKGKHLGKKMRWSDLSKETKKAIFARAL